ncbi:MAG: FMN-binding protein [Planctomycetota bacterium]|nr:FMN-binding protein [Planctomycetota bacterium]
MTAARAALALAAWLCALHAHASAEEKPAPKDDRLKVTVYYSKDDERWPEVEKAVEEAVEPYRKIIHFEKVRYDTKEGFTRLAQAEKDLGIAPGDRGDVTAVIGHFALIDKGGRRKDIERYMPRVLERMLMQNDLKERRKTDAEAYAKEIFGEKATLTKEDDADGNLYHRVEADGKFAGYIVDAYHVIWCPICADAQFLLAANASLKVKDVRAVHELEIYGVAVDEERAAKFLGQFKGRDPDKKVETLDTISGATKTSLAYDKAIEKVLAELKRRAGNAAPKKHEKDEP